MNPSYPNSFYNQNQSPQNIQPNPQLINQPSPNQYQIQQQQTQINQSYNPVSQTNNSEFKDQDNIQMPQEYQIGDKKYIKTGENQVIEDMGSARSLSTKELVKIKYEEIQNDPTAREFFNSLNPEAQSQYLVNSVISDYNKKYHLSGASQNKTADNNVSKATNNIANNNQSNMKINNEIGLAINQYDNSKFTTIHENPNGRITRTDTYTTQSSEITNIKPESPESNPSYENYNQPNNQQYRGNLYNNTTYAQSSENPQFTGEYYDKQDKTQHTESYTYPPLYQPQPNYTNTNPYTRIKKPSYLADRGFISICTLTILISSLIIGLSIGFILFNSK